MECYGLPSVRPTATTVKRLEASGRSSFGAAGRDAQRRESSWEPHTAPEDRSVGAATLPEGPAVASESCSRQLKVGLWACSPGNEPQASPARGELRSLSRARLAASDPSGGYLKRGKSNARQHRAR